MSARWSALALLSLALAGGIRAAEESPLPEPVGASVRQEAGVSIFEAILPGDLVDWLPQPNGGALALLIESPDEGEQRQLLWWPLVPEDGLHEVGEQLPEEVETLLGFVPGEEIAKSVVLGAGGTLLSLDEKGEWRELLQLPWDVHPLRNSRGGRFKSRESLVLRSVGGLYAVAPETATGRWRVQWQYDVPIQVDREWGGLRIASPPVVSLEGSLDPSLQWIVGPEAHGRRRLRSVQLIPSTDNDGLDSVEIWSMLPSAEELHESWYVIFDGAPALIVTTVLADKHGVFEKKKLRLFQLTADRTRSGSGPMLEALTRSRNWYGTCAGVADLNGDGRDDLVTAQPKGLGAGSLWVEAFLSRSEGGFETRPRGSEIDVEEGEICSLASDVDGDDRVDLVVVEDDSLLVFPLIVESDSKWIVAETPRWRIDFDDIEGRPRPVEVRLGAPTQMLVTGHTKGGRQAVRLIQFH